MSDSTLYQEVVSATYHYLGPAADRFVVRQIKNHLHKQPEELQKRDLKQLISWIRPARFLLSDDTKVIERYIADLQQLSQGKAGRAQGKHVDA